MNFRIFLYNIKSSNIFQSTQFNQDLQIECVAKPASSQLIELIESWDSIQFNIEALLNDLQPCPLALNFHRSELHHDSQLGQVRSYFIGPDPVQAQLSKNPTQPSESQVNLIYSKHFSRYKFFIL